MCSSSVTLPSRRSLWCADAAPFTPHMMAVCYGTEVATCGPCAWARWRGVVVAADAGGRVAVLRTVRADDPASHVCRSPAAGAAGAAGDPAEPAFRKLDKTGRVLPGRLSGPA